MAVTASAAVAAVRSTAAAYSATAAAWWKQRGGFGGFTGTVRECADAHAFERHQRTNVRVFVIGQGRRDDSADGIVVSGRDGGPIEMSTAVANAPPPPTMTRTWRRPPRSPMRRRRHQ